MSVVANFTEQAYTRLTDQASPLNWCVLIDPTLGDPSESLLEGMERQIERRRIRLPFPENYCPYLLRADNPRDAERLLSASIELARRELAGVSKGVARSVHAWLRLDMMDMSLRTLALRIGQNASAKAPFSPTSTVFRYYDPRLSARLIPIIGLDGWQALTGESWNAWWVADAREAVLPVVSASQATVIAPRKPPLHLTEREFRGIEHLGWSNRIETAAYQWDLPGTATRQRIEHIASAALSCGLTTDKDILAFANCALVWHPDFHAHPDIESILARIAGEEADAPNFSFMVEQIGDDRWRAMVRWLNDPQRAGAGKCPNAAETGLGRMT
jgi:hypothetical protein